MTQTYEFLHNMQETYHAFHSLIYTNYTTILYEIVCRMVSVTCSRVCPAVGVTYSRVCPAVGVTCSRVCPAVGVTCSSVSGGCRYV